MRCGGIIARLGAAAALVAAAAAQGNDPLAACRAGQGAQHVEYKGYLWRTLDGADPAGGRGIDPNDGCQCTNNGGNCPNNYLPLSEGYARAARRRLPRRRQGARLGHGLRRAGGWHLVVHVYPWRVPDELVYP